MDKALQDGEKLSICVDDMNDNQEAKTKELKIKVDDLAAMTSHILSLGAKFDKEISVRDTYFKRPKGEVLKISETGEGDSIVHLRAREGGFDYLQDEKITDAAARKKALEKEFGIKSVLVKKRRFYKLGNIILDFNIIDDVGTFLVVLGPNVSHDLIESYLGIKNPEYITVPFDELPKRKQH